MPQHPRAPFTPIETDPLLLDSISPESSSSLNDNSGESEPGSIQGDNFGEIAHKSLTHFEKDFHKNCGKPCEKVAFSGYKFLTSLDF